MLLYNDKLAKHVSGKKWFAKQKPKVLLLLFIWKMFHQEPTLVWINFAEVPYGVDLRLKFSACIRGNGIIQVSFWNKKLTLKELDFEKMWHLP